ncbi:MAG: phosphatidylglycerophosphatase A [bacterium]|jgi:phosphatidylglycerophosphatase A
MVKKLTILLSTGFGLGHSPLFPGSVGCLLGIPLVWAIQYSGLQLGMEIPFHITMAVLLSLIAIPICHVGEKAAGSKDPHCVVADEYLTFPISMIGLPFTPLMIAISFVTNRILDIFKPYPASQLQALPGGLGITIDDVFSATYSLALNHVVFWCLRHYGWL